MTDPNRGNWKLSIGKLRDAWWAYPRQRREIREFPAGRPIFVTGTHRSGTTWVAKMLAVEGLWYVHEPFNPNKGIWPKPFTYAAPDSTQPRVDRIMRRLLRGGLRQTLNLPNSDHPLMPLRLFPQPLRRVLLKDPLACLLTGYLTSAFDLQTLVLFRHPCGFVSSVIRLGWPTASFVRQLIDCEALVADHLGPHLPLLKGHCVEGGLPAAAALCGALNTVLWQTCLSHNLRWVRFEDLCRDPLGEFQELFEWADLPYCETVRKLHESLCFAPAGDPHSYHPHAVRRNSLAMAESWKRRLSPDEVVRVRDIWDQFDVPLYEEHEDWALEDHAANALVAPRSIDP